MSQAKRFEPPAYIELPPNARSGGFDHADIHSRTGRLYVAHTANDAVDVIDCVADRYLHSIPELKSVAGVLVSEEANLVFTSNRGEDTVSIFAPDAEHRISKVAVGHRPNGLAYDPERHILLVANVGDPALSGSTTASIVDVQSKSMIASVLMPGRTRWAIFDKQQDAFFINIAEPPCIVVIDAKNCGQIAKSFSIPAAGPHGLAVDSKNQRLFCACDAKKLICLDARTGKILDHLALSGPPDVIFFNDRLRHLYVAIGDPGLIDVVDTGAMKLTETVSTEFGAHTIGFDAPRNKLYAFLPETHRAAVYHDKS
jgi:DNA-binding beta-propeller fold protein YncE